MASSMPDRVSITKRCLWQGEPGWLCFAQTPQRASSAHGAHELGEDAAGHQHVVVDDEQVRVVASQPPVVRLRSTGTARLMRAPQAGARRTPQQSSARACMVGHIVRTQTVFECCVRVASRAPCSSSA